MGLMSGNNFSANSEYFSSVKSLLRSLQTELRMPLDKPPIPIFAGQTVFKGTQNVVLH